MTPVSNDSKTFVKTDLPREQERRGILSQGAIRSRLSTANQSSPIHRGKFSANAVVLVRSRRPSSRSGGVPAGARRGESGDDAERFAAHARTPRIRRHELLDSVGLGLEHFDATGRYREREGANEIDDSGYLVGTDVDGAFHGLSELSEKLLASAQGSARRRNGPATPSGAARRRAIRTLDKLEDAPVRSGGDLKL